jgi:1-pyrroline-5-carboxylate dehydrogenase
MAIPGAKLLFGGKPLENHSIPASYGSYYPTAVFLPID